EAAPRRAGGARGLEDGRGAADVDRGVERRVRDRLADVDLRREVKDDLRPGLAGQLEHRLAFADVGLDQPRARGQRLLEVLAAAGGEVVADRHLLAAPDQRGAQARPHESRPTCDEASHTNADPRALRDPLPGGDAGAPCYPRRPMRLIVTEKNNSAKKIAEILGKGGASEDKTFKVPYYTWSDESGEQRSIGLK